jgi:hypothetical protein
MTTPQKPNIKIPGPKVLLMGDSGTGKSFSIRTLIQAGVTPFVLATEQNAIQVLKDLPDGSWHYKYISPQPAHKWDQLADMIKKINTLSYENLTKTTDPYRQAHNRLYDVVTSLNSFTCECHGTNFGDVGTWGTDKALVFDGLSGLSDMAMALVVGNKPVRSMPDWGVAQNTIKMLLSPLTTTVHCPVILIAHIDREKDEITGGTNITVKTLGQKLAPDIPRMFSDVIRARREGNKFVWDTADTQTTLVARHVAIASSLEPSFVPLFKKWKEEGGVIGSLP